MRFRRHPLSSIAASGTSLTLLALLGGCGDAPRQQVEKPFPGGYDDIVVQDTHTRTMLLAADPTFGPDHFVYASVKIPENYLADGAIHLTNGRELRIVSPHAFKAYTGTALSVEEAEDVIARAHALDASADEFLDLVREMRQVLSDRAAAVHDAKVRAYDEADLRRSERHLSRTEQEFAQVSRQRQVLSEEVTEELALLDEMLQDLAERRRALTMAEASLDGEEPVVPVAAEHAPGYEPEDDDDDRPQAARPERDEPEQAEEIRSADPDRALPPPDDLQEDEE
ncbi:MAG: hypothetical protein ACOCXA_00545 [Planctomycetota bacterium]